MFDLAKLDPTGRFTGLGALYARTRPDYPAAALQFIVTRCRLGPGSVLIDVGCGTGISTRQLAALGLRVIGVDPNADMRAQAETAGRGDGPAPVYRAGQAEATGLADGSADAVLAAQAFHWFAPEPTLREFHRILKPDGWVVLLWNERDESDPFTAAYGNAVRASVAAATLEKSWQRNGAPLLASPHFEHGEHVQFAHEQSLDEEGVLGRAVSMSYAPREAWQVEAFLGALRRSFAAFQRDGKVVLRYKTTVVVAQRR